jgi:hypothetical protein
LVDFESLSLPSLKKYRTQFQIRIKPTVPKSELAAAIAEHFANIPVPEETEVIDQFLKALQKNRNSLSEIEESADEPGNLNKKVPAATSDLKKRLTEAETESIPKNSLQPNSKKLAKRNSIPKVESNRVKYL